jgi:hypothetical protein
LLLQLPSFFYTSFFFHFCSQQPAIKHESLLLLTKSPWKLTMSTSLQCLAWFSGHHVISCAQRASVKPVNAK